MKWICLLLALLLSGCSTVVSSKIERGAFVKAVATGNIKDEYTAYNIDVIDPLTIEVYRDNTRYEVFSNRYQKIKVSNVETKNATPIKGIATTAASIVVSPITILSDILNHDTDTKGMIKASKNAYYDKEGTISKQREIIPDDFFIEEELKFREKNKEPGTGSIDITINGNIAAEIPLDANGRAVVDLVKWPILKAQKNDITIKYNYKNIEASSLVPNSTVKRQFASLTPPNLSISKEILYEGGLKTGTLAAEESGSIVLIVANTDKQGTAWDGKLVVGGAQCKGVTVERLIPVGDLKPGEKKAVNIPLSAALEAPNCQLALTVQVKESFGNDSRKVTIPPIAIRALERPDLAIASITPSGTAQNNGRMDLAVTVKNGGVGEAKGVLLDLDSLPKGVTASRNRFEIGDMRPGSVQTETITFRFDKLFGKDITKLNIGLKVSDRRPIAKPSTRQVVLDFRFNMPKIKVADIHFYDGNDPENKSEGNSDALIQQNETIVARIKLVNTGTMAAENVKVTFTSDKASRINIQPADHLVATMRPQEEKILDFKFKVPGGMEPGQINFKVSTSESVFDSILTEEKQAKIFEDTGVLGDVQIAGIAKKPNSQKIASGNEEDIDVVPSSGYSRDAYALVIGIGRYQVPGVRQVKYAKNDAESVRDYLNKIGGVPRDNIRYLVDEQATISGIKKELGWIRRNATRADAQVFIYFAGHGIADNNKIPYLLPYEGDPQAVDDTGFSISALKDEIRKFKTKRVLVALDACYTGEGRSETTGGRGLARVEKDTTPSEAVILSASEINETSWDYDDKRHGIFTYYLLKGMRGAAPDINKNGYIDISEIFSYLKSEVPKASNRLRATQTPTLQGNGSGLIVSKRVK